MSRFNRFLRRISRVVVISTLGSALVVVGVALSLPGVPGPGLLLIIAGLAVLSKEFDWAQRLTTRLKERAGALRRRTFGRPADDDRSDEDERGDRKQRETAA
ncbi:MAG: PGPGW domain-containing protein [Nitriliruptorales bacterium]|nr:PGPGW domain-containing protein [Nitriliruptorales bacterium]